MFAHSAGSCRCVQASSAVSRVRAANADFCQVELIGQAAVQASAHEESCQ